MTNDEFSKQLENIILSSKVVDFVFAANSLCDMLTSLLIAEGVNDIEAMEMFIHSLYECRKSKYELDKVKNFMGIKDE